MFANVSVVGSTEPGAILVPQRAVTDLLYKHYVYVVNADNSVSMKEVQLAPALAVCGSSRAVLTVRKLLWLKAYRN